MIGGGVVFAGSALLLLSGCGGHGDQMHGPMGPNGGYQGTGGNMGGMPAASAGLLAVDPRAGAVGVSTSTSVQIRFGYGMGPGMEQWVDLHRGDLSGPVVPWSCGWSSDRSTLTCTPTSALDPGTRYVVHVGGGMTDANGQHVDFSSGLGLGGTWIMGGMMGSMMGVGHAGGPWAGMGTGWMDPSNGAYGMAFFFTTA